jgi:hypothetical protein
MRCGECGYHRYHRYRRYRRRRHQQAHHHHPYPWSKCLLACSMDKHCHNHKRSYKDHHRHLLLACQPIERVGIATMYNNLNNLLLYAIAMAGDKTNL